MAQVMIINPENICENDEPEQRFFGSVWGENEKIIMTM